MNVRGRIAAALLATAMVVPPVGAATLIVINARGSSMKPGQKIDSAKPIQLKEGELVTVIGPDGRAVTLRGKFAGPPMPRAAAAGDPRQALAALVSTRNARTSSVGVVRSASSAAPLPQPWLIDVSRSGERCLREGDAPVWWRPASAAAQSFTVFPIDRSWRADFAWRSGETQMQVPPLAKFDGQTIFVIRADGQEYAVSVNLVPADLDNDFVLVSWMLEKGCIQQADALIRQLQQGRPQPTPQPMPQPQPQPSQPTS